MSCRLCLETQENSLDITSEEAVRSNVPSILYKYFKFCFDIEPDTGFVCQKCWWEVKIFDAFYNRIEGIHGSAYANESIFVDGVDHHLPKDEVNDDIDNFKQPTMEYPNTEFLCDLLAVDKTAKLEKHVGVDERVPKVRVRKRKSQREKSLMKTDPRPTKPSYKANYKARARNPSKIYNCETCDLPFLSEYKLYCHTKEVHLVQPFKCTEAKCVESYASQELLNEHINQNHSRVNCPHCSKMIKLYYLPLHIKFYHDKDQRIVCDLCGNVSNNINTHKSHHRLVHDVQPRLQCDICKDWSRNKNSMREHMRVRHIQGPERCSICGKISANKKALMKHKKFHFAEAREKFKCTVCGRGFRDSTKLKEHSYIHSGISDVYRCNYCEKSFRFASSMYAHRKKAHPSEESCRTSQPLSSADSAN